MTLIATDKLNLVRQLVEIFKNAKPFNGFDEEYKWKLLDLCEGKGCLEIIENLKGKNLVDNMRVDAVFKKLKETKPNELSACIEKLFEDSVPLEDRLEQYKTSMRNMCDDSIKSCANDERTAAALLTCHNPNTYTFYKDEVYQLVCQYFGVESEKPGKKYKHFLELISEVEAKYGNEIQALMQNQISQYKNKPIKLAVQTLFWCMKEEIKNITSTNMQLSEKSNSHLEEYIELLKENKNLVLTGAPGTGKTYMAHEIAREMGAKDDNVGFVQFHPSYDYSDFVEGLRPNEDVEDGHIGFVRRNGAFKDFCARAEQNLRDSQKDFSVLKKEDEIELKINTFLEKCGNDTFKTKPDHCTKLVLMKNTYFSILKIRIFHPII